MQIHLVRHSYDLDGFRGGWSSQGLSPQGRAQARALGARLRREGWTVDTLIASDLPRAWETAALLGLGEPASAPEWRETNNGALAGMPNVEAEERYPGLYWNKLAMDEPYPGGGESPNAFRDRVLAAFQQLQADVGAGRRGPRVMVVTHGGVIGVVASHVAGVEWSNGLKGFGTACTGIWTFEPGAGGRWAATRANDHAHLDDALRDAVELADYDPRWPLAYADERNRIARALGAQAVIEHVGSTAIPGTPAKPVLDILVGLERLELTASQAAALEAIGYEARGERSGVEGRLFFRKGNPRTHHVHVVQRGGELWQNYLLFRDYLRSHPDAAARYASLKRDLAQAFAGERPRYTDNKTPFVAEILAAARTWRS